MILVTETEIVLSYSGNCYAIELERIRNERDLLAWAVHLSEKNWMNAERLRDFILVVAQVKNLHVLGT